MDVKEHQNTPLKEIVSTQRNAKHASKVQKTQQDAHARRSNLSKGATFALLEVSKFRPALLRSRGVYPSVNRGMPVGWYRRYRTPHAAAQLCVPTS